MLVRRCVAGRGRELPRLVRQSILRRMANEQDQRSGEPQAPPRERSRVVTIGDVMVELTRGTDGRFTISCSGDAFNTAIYLARAGVEVAFAGALGDDPYSDSILALAMEENVRRDLILRVRGRMPALGLLDKDASGEWGLHQWGDAAPARELFELSEWPHIAEGLVGARLVYFTGVTLSLYSNVGLGRFLAALEMARKAGARIAFDGNFRPHGWKGDVGRARAVFIEALKRVDLALPTFDDEAILWGDPSPEATVDRLQAFGIPEVVVKNGPQSALVAAGGTREHVPVPEAVELLDAFGGGDGFNAAYLAARLQGTAPLNATMSGHKLAAQVLRHRGPITSRPGAVVH
jgi:2-dehydro-3-deoxygluconokinase